MGREKESESEYRGKLDIHIDGERERMRVSMGGRQYNIISATENV